MNDITIAHDTLRLGDLTLRFMRTLRIPDDGRDYPLPPGLGTFPLRRVADYADRVPDGWAERGGVFLPMYQREAMWLSFGQTRRALKVGVGKVCAITGERWTDRLERHPQNYVVTGTQPWLDGIATGKGTIRQFVAMPLGMGYTVEGQVTGEERFGGVQLQAFGPRPGALPDLGPFRTLGGLNGMAGGPPPAPCAAPAPRRCGRRRRSGSMGLAAGGRMKQKIYPDPYGVDTWDRTERNRCFVHIVNSELWREITGEEPPKSPVTARSYAKAGLPWFDLYDEHAPTVTPTETLKSVKSVKEMDADTFGAALQDDAPVTVGPLKKLGRALRGVVSVDDGEW